MPEAPRLVVCNTTPLVALFLLGQLELLAKLYGSVVIPPMVREEFLAGPLPHLRAAVLENAPWIRVVHLQSPRRAEMRQIWIEAKQRSLRLLKNNRQTSSSWMRDWAESMCID